MKRENDDTYDFDQKELRPTLIALSESDSLSPASKLVFTTISKLFTDKFVITRNYHHAEACKIFI